MDSIQDGATLKGMKLENSNAYKLTHPHWLGVSCILDNVPVNKMLKMLFDISCCRLKVSGLKPLYIGTWHLFTKQACWHSTMSKL